MSFKKVKPFLFLFLFTSLLFVSPKTVFAHPLDTTYLDLIIKTDETGKPIPKNEIQARYYFTWPQALYLERKAGSNKDDENKLKELLSSKNGTINPEDFGLSEEDAILKTLTSNPKAYKNYIDENVTISNNGEMCEPKFIALPEQDINNVLFNKGVKVNYGYICKDNINRIDIVNNLFTKDFSYQTNIINVFDTPTSGNAIKGGLLTSREPTFTIQLEKESDKSVAPITIGNNKFVNSLVSNFSNTVKASLPLAIIIVFLVGIMHTLEAGHSKTILGAALLDHRITTKQSFLYIGVFVLTHIADILILGVLLLVANSFVNIYEKLSFLQEFAIYALLLIAIYMLLDSITKLVKKLLHKKLNNHDHTHDHEHEHTHPEDELLHDMEAGSNHHHKKSDIKRMIILGFIAGMAPCLMGWSIFLVVLSTHNVLALIPIIISFAAGIATALILFALLVIKFKGVILKRASWIGEVTPIISSLILLAYALVLIM